MRSECPGDYEYACRTTRNGLTGANMPAFARVGLATKRSYWGERHWLPGYNTFERGTPSALQTFFIRPDNRNRESRRFCQLFQKHNASGETQEPKGKINTNLRTL